jgi:TIGR03009 family protein
MRNFTYTLLVLILAPLTSSAQENVDTVVHGWKKAMGELQSLFAVVERKTSDSLGDDHLQGYAMLMKPQAGGGGNMARLELAKDPKSDPIEKFIVTGPTLYQYAFKSKTVHVVPMPKNANANGQDSLFAFLFGMSAEDVKKRFDIKLTDQDKNYYHLDLTPKLEQDRTDFVAAKLYLYRGNNMPARIWFFQANKKTIQWDFKKLQMNVKIPVEKYFVYQEMKDWRVERGDKTPQIGPAGKK